MFESHHFQEAQAEEDHDPLLLRCPLAAHVRKLQIYRENGLLSFGVQGYYFFVVCFVKKIGN